MKSTLLNCLIPAVCFFLITDCSHERQLEAANLDPFIDFLTEKMDNYSAWLTANHLDPSPPLNNSITLDRPYGSVQLRCELSNQVLSGKSNLEKATSDIESSFGPEVHFVGVGQTYSTPVVEYHGTFHCSGQVEKSYFPELAQDVPFNGQGNYVVSTNFTRELFDINNLGITADSRVNFTHSWPMYRAPWTVMGRVQLQGTWNDTRVRDQYLANVTQAFRLIFYDFLHSRARDNVLYNPSAQLFNKYLCEILEDVVLTDIIGEEDAPPVYIPTPSTTTTTTTTTTTPGTTPSTTTTTTTASTTTTTTTTSTTTPSSTSTTTKASSSSTTPSTPSPSLATRSTSNYWVILSFVILVIYVENCAPR